MHYSSSHMVKGLVWKIILFKLTPTSVSEPFMFIHCSLVYMMECTIYLHIIINLWILYCSMFSVIDGINYLDTSINLWTSHNFILFHIQQKSQCIAGAWKHISTMDITDKDLFLKFRIIIVQLFTTWFSDPKGCVMIIKGVANSKVSHCSFKIIADVTWTTIPCAS